MMKIIYKQDDGTVAVVHPNPAALAYRTLEQIAQRSVPKGREYQIVEDSIIPAERTFRDAWQANGAAIAIDMPKARAIHAERIKNRRAELMDRPSLAEKFGKDATEIRAVDATAEIEQAATPDALKAVWPAALELRSVPR